MSQTRDLEKLAFWNAPDATLVLESRVIVAANLQAEAVFGWSPQELIGQSIRILYPNLTDYTVIGARARKAMTKTRIYRDMRFMRRKNDQIVWMEGCGTALDQENPEHCSIWTYRPISEERPNEGILTLAEKRVARYLISGLTSKEIAQHIGCSHRTIEVHRANMIRKFNVRNSFELVHHLLTGELSLRG